MRNERKENRWSISTRRGISGSQDPGELAPTRVSLQDPRIMGILSIMCRLTVLDRTLRLAVEIQTSSQMIKDSHISRILRASQMLVLESQTMVGTTGERRSSLHPLRLSTDSGLPLTMA